MLWRTPHSLQFGVDRPPRHPPPCLHGGRTDDLRADARSDPARAQRDRARGRRSRGGCRRPARRAAPVLAPPSRPQPRRVVSLQGSGEAARHIAACLAERGIDLYRPGSGRREPKAGVDLAIVVADYTIAPEATATGSDGTCRTCRSSSATPRSKSGRSSSRVPGRASTASSGIERMPIRRGRRSSLSCGGAAARVDAVHAVGSALVAAETAALAARLALARLGGSLAAAATSWRLDAADRRGHDVDLGRHPLCSCAGSAPHRLPRGQFGQEPRRLALAGALRAALSPGEVQPSPRAGDPDVEQAAFLVDRPRHPSRSRSAPGLRSARRGRRSPTRVPWPSAASPASRPPGSVRAVRPSARTGRRRTRGGSPRRGCASASPMIALRDSQRSRTAPRASGGSWVQPRERSTSLTVLNSGSRVGATVAPLSIMSACLTSCRSKNRVAPRS